jgi:Coenzyme PQQ synthesis protein D (PqqD)
MLHAEKRETKEMNLKIPDDVMFRILGDEAVILNVASGVYFGLDSVGTRMWQLMSEHGSTDKVIEALVDEYEVEEAQVRQDLDNLIRQLSDKGLVITDATETSPAK